VVMVSYCPGCVYVMVSKHMSIVDDVRPVDAEVTPTGADPSCEAPVVG
jgi:hypothetical protein